jgi:hypothetical protein
VILKSIDVADHGAEPAFAFLRDFPLVIDAMRGGGDSSI